MRTIARINADGSLLLRGEVFELVASWDDTQDIDEEFEIDEDTEIDDDLDFELLVEILTGLQNQWSDVDGAYFDNKGNLYVNELLETLSVRFNAEKEIEVTEIEEGVDLDA